MDTEVKIKEILSFVFSLDTDFDYSKLSIENNSDWDSMKQVTIITAIENEFDVFIEADQAASLTSFEKIIDYIKANS